MRNTKQRQLVLETVQGCQQHQSADQVYDAVHQINPRISRATVYRNLNQLAETGQVRHVQIPGSASDVFDYRTEPHSHIICSVCGSINDVKHGDHHQRDVEVSKMSGYKEVTHSTVYYGVCPSCQKKHH